MVKRLFIVLIAYSIFITIVGYSLEINTERSALSEIENSFTYLLKHNMKSELFNILIGISTFGIGSMVLLTLNFTALGASINILTKEMGFLKAMNYIYPHGIFEIPSMIIAAFLGIYIPISIAIWLKYKKNNFKTIIRLIGILILLTTVAALIESYITPLFIN